MTAHPFAQRSSPAALGFCSSSIALAALVVASRPSGGGAARNKSTIVGAIDSQFGFFVNRLISGHHLSISAFWYRPKASSV